MYSYSVSACVLHVIVGPLFGKHLGSLGGYVKLPVLFV